MHTIDSMKEKKVDLEKNKDDVIVQLTKLALVGRRQDIQMYVRRLAKRKDMADIKEQLNELMRDMPSQASPTRSSSFSAVPVDLDSRIQLLRHEPVTSLEVEPIWGKDVRDSLDQIIDERSRIQELQKAGLQPTKTALFIGAPGVGKTLAAKWLSLKLNKPLFILDLSAVMSSYLGRTGANLRMVLDYAKSIDCIILLDEIDAIAKKRDDLGEVGELKRLVTVLLQEVDDWPSNNLMLAATNHANLLDPAIWRRFDNIIEFPLPSIEIIRKTLESYLSNSNYKNEEMVGVLSVILHGKSFSDIEKVALRLKRDTVLKNITLDDLIETEVLKRLDELNKDEKRSLVRVFTAFKYSQRRISALLGVSRDTIRKVAN
ncbi:MAG TPA: ATP-binding protein [Candidatus Saccharimonadales bacterium]|nr:ATP-binding protein [Candidatus Saccharimonadales bacterium]